MGRRWALCDPCHPSRGSGCFLRPRPAWFKGKAAPSLERLKRPLTCEYTCDGILLSSKKEGIVDMFNNRDRAKHTFPSKSRWTEITHRGIPSV